VDVEKFVAGVNAHADPAPTASSPSQREAEPVSDAQVAELRPKVTSPFVSIVIALVEDVAKPATVVVAIYKFPPAFRKVHWEKLAPADRAS
jgi:hypothetical protein